MAVFTIAGLTLKEAIRRRTLLGALVLGLLVLALSLIVTVVRMRMAYLVSVDRMTPEVMAIRLPLVRSAITVLCISSIKALGALFAILLAGGSISAEIERGLLAVILTKPLPRWQILLGKWIGLNAILVASVLVWTVMLWASLTLQVRQTDRALDLTPILWAGPALALFPVLVSTVTLSFSTFAQRVFGTSLALALCAFAWFDGIFNALGNQFDVDSLRGLADVAGLVVPQGYVAWWVEEALGGEERGVILDPPGRALSWISSRMLKTWGQTHWHFDHLDGVYVATYIFVVFLVGAVVFQRRDV